MALQRLLTDSVGQEWGMKFPPERIQAMQEASKLKRIATVEVSSTTRSRLFFLC